MKTKHYLLSALAALILTPAMAQGPVPVPEKYKLKNGLEVIFLEYGTLPATCLSFFVNTGRKNETPGQQYLSQLTAAGLQLGSEKYSRIETDNLVTELGGSSEVSANDNFTAVHLSFPNNDAERAMDLISATLLKPKFPQEELKQHVSQQLNYNNPTRMDITALTAMYGDMYVYGTAHPLGRHFYAAQLSKITPAQVKEFYQFNYTPKNTKLVVCGKPDKEKMKKLIEQYLGPWTAEFGEVNGSAYEMPAIDKQEVAFVNKPRATQAALRWYKKAPAAGSKDVLAFRLANVAFNDILFDEIRGKEGKTYGINSQYNEGENRGTFNVSTQVRNEVLFATVQSFDRVLKEFYEKGITADQLERSRSVLKNAVLGMQEPDQVAGFINPWVHGDIEKRRNFTAEIDKLDLAAVNKIIRKYYSPDSYKLVIAGDDTKLEQQLQQIKGLARIPLKSIEADN